MPAVKGFYFSEVVSVREMLKVRETECYKEVFEVESKFEEKALAELSAAVADKITLMEHLATSHVKYAEFDLEICRRYAQCYEITDDERSIYVVNCITQREQRVNEIVDLLTK